MSDSDDRPRDDDDQDEGPKINDPLTKDDDEKAPRETFGESPKD